MRHEQKPNLFGHNTALKQTKKGHQQVMTISGDEFLAHLRSALNHLYDPYFLQKSALVKFFGLSGQPDTPSALQHILNDAIDGLKPKADDPHPEQNPLNYELILYRYVQQFSQEEVATQLGLSVRHLRRKQNTAIYSLGANLWARFNPGIPLQPESLLVLEDHQAGNEPEDSTDLDWLKDTPLTEPADLEQILPIVLELSRPLAAKHGIELTLQSKQKPLMVAIQPVVLRQILLNVLSAAISHARQGQIKIDIFGDTRGVEIHITCDRRQRNIEPDISSQQDNLTIAARMAQLSGGGLEYIENEKTLETRVRLPVFHQITVLVIDDNPDFHQLIQRETSGTQYKIIGERHPEKGLALAEEITPSIVLLDVMMPRMDGWEVLGRLRRHPRTEHIPVIICTVLAQEDLALSLGAADFIRKPIKWGQILAALDRQRALLEQESH